MPQTPADTDLYAALLRKTWNDVAFREALRANPRATIERELNIVLPKGLQIEILEETPTKVYVVIPARPPHAEGRELSDAELATAAGGVSGGCTSMPLARGTGSVPVVEIGGGVERLLNPARDRGI